MDVDIESIKKSFYNFINSADHRIATTTLTTVHGGLALNPGEKLCGL